MKQDDVLVFVFMWLVPSAGFGVILGYSEYLGYELQGCQPDIASWLRPVLIQYLLIFFLMTYVNYLPEKYLAYLDRFALDEISAALALIFIIMQIATPWITLTLYLKLRNGCGEQITSTHSKLCWVLFSLQLLICLLALVFLYFFSGMINGVVIAPIKLRMVKRAYSNKVSDILVSGENVRSDYVKLVAQYPNLSMLLLQGELDIFKLLLCRSLDQKCVGILRTQQRKCFRCKEGFQLRDRVHFMNHCYHLAHWECFISALAHRGECSECGQPSVSELKSAIMNDGLRQDLYSLLQTLPNIRPTFQESDRHLLQIPPLNR